MSPVHSANGADSGLWSHPGWFWAALIAVVLWLMAIATLAVFTANPPTINRTQVVSSEVVVTGRLSKISPAGVAEVDVVHAFTQGDVPAEVRIPHMPKQLVQTGRDYLLPLTKRGDRFEITPAPRHAEETRLVYPATEEVRETVETLLQSIPPRPYP